MRTMFFVYLTVIAIGLLFYIAIGFTGQ